MSVFQNINNHPKFIPALMACSVLLPMLALLPAHAFGASLSDVDAVPHLDDMGRVAYRDFLAEPNHRAFAIAPGGGWSWYGSAPSAETVSSSALEGCRQATGRSCALYAVDDKVVFDKQGWTSLWGPYLNRAEADAARTGTAYGERFHDLVFRDASGRQLSIAGQRGKVTIVHIWGSWCPPCRKELPELAQLNAELKNLPDVQMVMLQVREDIATSYKWASEENLKLPLYDSGVQGVSDEMLTDSDGLTVHDRDIAAGFPSTYVLDKHGIVVFFHLGPISGWDQYLPFLRDVAARSGK